MRTTEVCEPGFGTKRPVLRPTGELVGWQGTSRAHEYATLRKMTTTSETKLRKSGRVLTSHRRSAEAARYFRWK